VRESKKKWESSIERIKTNSDNDWLKENAEGSKIAAGREDF
jgi:hypothetical protein